MLEKEREMGKEYDRQRSHGGQAWQHMMIWKKSLVGYLPSLLRFIRLICLAYQHVFMYVIYIYCLHKTWKFNVKMDKKKRSGRLCLLDILVFSFWEQNTTC